MPYRRPRPKCLCNGPTTRAIWIRRIKHHGSETTTKWSRFWRGLGKFAIVVGILASLIVIDTRFPEVLNAAVRAVGIRVPEIQPYMDPTVEKYFASAPYIHPVTGEVSIDSSTVAKSVQRMVEQGELTGPFHDRACRAQALRSLAERERPQAIRYMEQTDSSGGPIFDLLLTNTRQIVDLHVQVEKLPSKLYTNSELDSLARLLAFEMSYMAQVAKEYVPRYRDLFVCQQVARKYCIAMHYLSIMQPLPGMDAGDSKSSIEQLKADVDAAWQNVWVLVPEECRSIDCTQVEIPEDVKDAEWRRMNLAGSKTP